MPTEDEIGQEIAVILHAHLSAAPADLASALTHYAYHLALDAAAAALRPYLLGHGPALAAAPGATP